jgi:glutamyl-tRNA synthetase
MNGVYIRGLDPGDFAGRALPFVEAALGRALTGTERELFTAIAPLVQERAKRLDEVAAQVRFLFADEVAYDEASWQKVMEKEGVAEVLRSAAARLAALEAWETGPIEEALRGLLADLGLSARKGLQPIRVAVTGSQVSPPLFESLEALGRERSLERLEASAGRL